MGSKVFRNASTRFAIGGKRPQRGAQPFFSCLAKVNAVFLMEVRENVGRNQPQNAADQNDVGPGTDKSGDRAAALTTKQ